MYVARSASEPVFSSGLTLVLVVSGFASREDGKAAAIFDSFVQSCITSEYQFMSRRLQNWNYRGVTSFLRANGFEMFGQMRGSHQSWIKDTADGCRTTVGVNFTQRNYPVGTLLRMIRQSGISKDAWIRWKGS